LRKTQKGNLILTLGAELGSTVKAFVDKAISDGLLQEFNRNEKMFREAFGISPEATITLSPDLSYNASTDTLSLFPNKDVTKFYRVAVDGKREITFRDIKEAKAVKTVDLIGNCPSSYFQCFVAVRAIALVREKEDLSAKIWVNVDKVNLWASQTKKEETNSAEEERLTQQSLEAFQQSSKKQRIQ
jgi:hypothetical protein